MNARLLGYATSQGWTALSALLHRRAHSLKYFDETPSVAHCMSNEYNHRLNRLLASLPTDSFERLHPHLQLVPMPLGQVLLHQHVRFDHVYFPTTAAVSLVSILKSGASAEIGLIGNEGMLGTSLVLGGVDSAWQAVVPSLDDSPRSPPDVGDPFATSDPFSVAGDRVTSPGDSSARDAPPPPVLPPAIADVTHEPVGIDAGAEAPIPVAKRRRRAIVLALMLFGIAFLLFVGIRAITRSGHTVATEEEPSTSGHKTWVAAPKTVASSPATGAAGATEATTAANTVTTAATTSPSTNASTTASGASTMASTGGESSAATAATSATGLSPTAATGVSGGGAPAPTGTGTVHAKPKPTYDPLGI